MDTITFPSVAHTHRRAISSRTSPASDFIDGWTQKSNVKLRDLNGESILEEDYHAPHLVTLVTSNTDKEASTARQGRQQPGRHQRSLSAFLPSFAVSRTNSLIPSEAPIKELADFMPTFTGDKDGEIKIADKPRGGLGGWFSGTSAPVSIGINVPAQDLTPRTAPPERPEANLKARSPDLSAKTVSRFSFFSPKSLTLKTMQAPVSPDADEFLSLDIQAALFPSVDMTDASSPAAFQSLLMNAETLILRLQTAYKIRSLAVHELTAEKEAQVEEREEAETRVKHLKIQLEDMAARVNEQDAAIEELVVQLANEKQTRAEENEARKKSINLIQTNREVMESMEPFEDEDLGIATARTSRLQHESRSHVHRRSRSTSTIVSAVASYSSDDDDASSSSESVFSTTTPTISSNITRRRRNTLRKILTGVNPAMSKETEVEDELPMDVCSNCRGQHASVAWDTVNTMRAENQGLKVRVQDLECAVECALELCSGIGIVA